MRLATNFSGVVTGSVSEASEARYEGYGAAARSIEEAGHGEVEGRAAGGIADEANEVVSARHNNLDLLTRHYRVVQGLPDRLYVCPSYPIRGRLKIVRDAVAAQAIKYNACLDRTLLEKGEKSGGRISDYLGVLDEGLHAITRGTSSKILPMLRATILSPKLFVNKDPQKCLKFCKQNACAAQPLAHRLQHELNNHSEFGRYQTHESNKQGSAGTVAAAARWLCRAALRFGGGR